MLKLSAKVITRVLAKVKVANNNSSTFRLVEPDAPLPAVLLPAVASLLPFSVLIALVAVVAMVSVPTVAAVVVVDVPPTASQEKKAFTCTIIQTLAASIGSHLFSALQFNSWELAVSEFKIVRNAAFSEN